MLTKGRYSEHKKTFTAKLWIPEIALITFWYAGQISHFFFFFLKHIGTEWTPTLGGGSNLIKYWHLHTDLESACFFL